MDSPSRRQPSASFPGIALREAVETVREVAKYGTDHSRNAFAQYLGHSTAYSGPFKSKLAAFRDWNFVTTGPDLVSLTPLAQRLAFPPDPSRVQADLVEAFRSCAPFLDLYNACAKGQPLDRTTIANNGVHRLRVSPGSKDRFATSFIQSAAYAGLADELPDGRVRLFPEPNSRPDEATVDEGALANSDEHATRTWHGPPIAAPTRFEMPWRVSGGHVALSVELDRPLPAEAFRHLTAISTAIEALVESLRGSNDHGQAIDDAPQNEE